MTEFFVRFESMSAVNAKRTFIIYSNFVQINKHLRSLLVWVRADLKFELALDVQDVEISVIKSM